MSIVVEKLENALEYQEVYDLKLKPPEGYMEILMAARPPLKFRSLEDLNLLLSNGVFLNADKTWFSINDNGEHSEFISIGECLVPEEGESYEYTHDYNSRFPVGALRMSKCRFKTCLRPQFLSTHIMYTVNLVFKSDYEHSGKQLVICLNYRLEGQAEQDNACSCAVAYRREDNWWTAELCQFTSDGPDFSSYITFHGYIWEGVLVEGIEFQPIGKVEHRVSDDEKREDMQLSISESSNDDETYWEQMLPNYYQHIIEHSKYKLQWTTKKELYSIFSKGFLIVNNRSFFEPLFNSGDHQWFSLDKRGKTCLTLSPRRACTLEGPYYNYTWRSLPKSRFREALVIGRLFEINILPLNGQHILSPHTRYGSYLVYKLPEGRFIYQRTQKGLSIKLSATGHSMDWYVFLISPQIPVVRPKVGENALHPPARRPKIEDLPQQRSDGWMEVKLYQFQVDTTTQEVVIPNVVLVDDSIQDLFKGMMIQCVEIRPI